MNSNVKMFFIFAIGAGIGSFVTCQYLNRYYYTNAKEGEDVVTYDEFIQKKKEKELKEKIEENSLKKEELNSYNEIIDNYKNCMVDRKMYNDFSKKEYEEEDSDEFPDDFVSSPTMTTMSSVRKEIPEPYVISIEEFSDGMQNFDKLTINYYETDDTLVDENEEVITDVDSVISGDSLLCFGEESDDPDIVYVRNEKLSTDFEVIRTNKSYQRDILGIVDDIPRKNKHHEK